MILTHEVLSASHALNISYPQSFEWVRCAQCFLSMERVRCAVSYLWSFKWVRCAHCFLPVEFWISQVCSLFLTYGVLSESDVLIVSYLWSFEWVRHAHCFLPMEFSLLQSLHFSTRLAWPLPPVRGYESWQQTHNLVSATGYNNNSGHNLVSATGSQQL